MLRLAEFRVNKNARYCPSGSCDHVEIVAVPAEEGEEGEEGEGEEKKISFFPKIECEKCEFLFCFHCQTEWHEGKTCEEAKQEKEKELGWWKGWKKRKEEKKTAEFFEKNRFFFFFFFFLTISIVLSPSLPSFSTPLLER